MKNEICPRIIRENLLRVETGQELTLPLATLNRSCEFRKRYAEIYGGIGYVTTANKKRNLQKIKEVEEKIKRIK